MGMKFARIVHWLGLPGFVKPWRFYDEDIGKAIEIKTSPYYTTLKIGDTEYFFNRESGKYDGFGMMQCESTQTDTTSETP